MPQITFSTNAKPVAALLKRFGEQVVVDVQDELFDAQNRIKDELSVPGTQVAHPVKWSGEEDSRLHTTKQQRAFFASEGFGGGIPHERTDRHVKGWKVTRLTNGSMIENNVKGSKMLYGDFRGQGQAPMFQGAWVLFRRVVDGVYAKLPITVMNAMRKLASRLS